MSATSVQRQIADDYARYRISAAQNYEWWRRRGRCPDRRMYKPLASFWAHKLHPQRVKRVRLALPVSPFEIDSLIRPGKHRNGV